MKSKKSHGASAIKNPMAANNRGKTSSRPGRTGHAIQRPRPGHGGVDPHTLGRSTPKAKPMM